MFSLLPMFILIHECGHCFLGRNFGLEIEKFNLGFGHGIKIGVLNLGIPITGKVYFADNGLFRLPAWQQNIVVGAGPFFGLIFGILTWPICPVFSILAILASGIDLAPIQIFGSLTDGRYIFRNIRKEAQHDL